MDKYSALIRSYIATDIFLPIVSETVAYHIRFFHAIFERSRVHFIRTTIIPVSSSRTKAFKQFEKEVWSIFYTIWREIPGGAGEPA